MQGALQLGVTEWNWEILWEGPFAGIRAAVCVHCSIRTSF